MEGLPSVDETIKMGPIKKRPFSVSEDLQIIQFVSQSLAQVDYANSTSSTPKSTIKWNIIALTLGRSSKQVRERWNGHLNPSINKGPWTLNEDILIATKQKEFGNKWAEIVKFLPGRTDTMVKNRWNTYIKTRVMELLDPHRNPFCSYSSNNFSQSKIGLKPFNEYLQFAQPNFTEVIPSSPPSPISDITETPNNAANISIQSVRASPIDEWLQQIQSNRHSLISISDFRQLPPLIQH